MLVVCVVVWQLNSFLHALLFNGIWMDRDGLLSALPGVNGKAPLRVHVYVELPALHNWPPAELAIGVCVFVHVRVAEMCNVVVKG